VLLRLRRLDQRQAEMDRVGHGWVLAGLMFRFTSP
jgi:hypothetical protein